MPEIVAKIIKNEIHVTVVNGGRGASGAIGEKGDKGDQGIQGERGLQGEQGIQGIQGLKGDTGDTGAKGDTGLQGIQGIKGDKGDTGSAGANGIDGKSAYEVAVAGGYVGTEAQWLLSLKGANGIQGEQGLQGAKGDQGIQGEQGIQGVKGDTGLTGPAGTTNHALLTNIGTKTHAQIETDLSTLSTNKLDKTGGTITNYAETVTASNSSTAITISLANGNIQDITLTGNTTITLPDANSSTSAWSLTLRIIGGASAYSVTYAVASGDTLVWLTSDNIAPTLNNASGKINVLVFESQGTTKVLGHFAGKQA